MEKDGAPFEANDATVISQDEGSTITLDGTKEIGGHYQCVASNKWGKAFSNNTYLPRARKSSQRTARSCRAVIAQLTVWHPTSDNPLPDIVMTKSTYAYLCFRDLWVKTPSPEKGLKFCRWDLLYLLSGLVTISKPLYEVTKKQGAGLRLPCNHATVSIPDLFLDSRKRSQFVWDENNNRKLPLCGWRNW